MVSVQRPGPSASGGPLGGKFYNARISIWQGTGHHERIMGGSHVENVADLACRTALSYRGVAHITFPVDFQEEPARPRNASKRNIPHHTSDVFARSARLPDQGDLRAAADILNEEQLAEQLSDWVACGIPRVKMKVGRSPRDDRGRVRAARRAIGADAELFVDANGAYSCTQALAFAQAFREFDVTWFEEPVSSDDLEGLRRVRDRAPAGVDVAAGEYGYDVQYLRRMLDAGAVGVLQADATRCGGITGLMRASALCEAHALPMSAHTAPSIHLHPCCALGPMRHIEYFHDHVRIEHMFFDGVRDPVDGALRPDLTRPGLGLTLKRRDIDAYRVFGDL